jgi:hypothetical protein
MASVFWDADGILFIDYPEKGKTITWEYFSNFKPDCTKKFVRKERFAKEKYRLSSGQCTRPQKCMAMGKLRDLHYKLLKHPLYSPDLAPFDFYHFPKRKIFLAGQRFSSKQEAIAAVEVYFVDLMKNHYSSKIMALKHR